MSAIAISKLNTPAQAADDPIFGAIDAHKRAYAAFSDALSEIDELEKTIQRDKRKTQLSFSDEIIETDDPRWITWEKQLRALRDAEGDAECSLVSIVPTTLQGILALLQYAAEHEKKGLAWPTGL